MDEISRMMSLYRELFGPLDAKQVRVTGIPLAHGRGFDGLILLGQSAGFAHGSSEADMFRAHEVAHQWWGNEVRPRNWPEDRWLSESLAEYSALEYYRRRHEREGWTRDLIYRDWVIPVLESPSDLRRNLLGEKRNERLGERYALVDGTHSFYTKGPMVLRMLQYLFEVETGDERAFWALLREFLERHRRQQVTTRDFLALAASHLSADLDWFWDQWLYGRELPAIQWKHAVTRVDGGWELVVAARQQETDYRLLIPVTVQFAGGTEQRLPLWVEGAEGGLQRVFPEKPTKVTLNDNWESLVAIRR